ncbi:MAG: hypothetical protein KIS81_09380 [Maricaulaceae bacterium]|nr:hypothetical protein [Maricaulaceae bacterium]
MRCLIAAITALALCSAAAAQEAVYQTDSLFGERLYTQPGQTLNVAGEDALARAEAEARAAWEAGPSPDTGSWYGRVLAYQGYYREALAVYDAAIARFPDSARLRRHRAHRHFTLRDFQASIEEGLRAVALYEGRPLERERSGVTDETGAGDVVQFYLFYHLGQAYYARGEFGAAADWFGRASEVAFFTGQAEDDIAAIYWLYLSLARGGFWREAQDLILTFPYSEEDLQGGGSVYYDGVTLFLGERDPESFFTDEDTGLPFADASGVAASTAFSLANFYLLDGRPDAAKPWLARAVTVEGWAYFARIQAEAEFARLFPGETP